jgi:hypothetical protein
VLPVKMATASTTMPITASASTAIRVDHPPYRERPRFLRRSFIIRIYLDIFTIVRARRKAPGSA